MIYHALLSLVALSLSTLSLAADDSFSIEGETMNLRGTELARFDQPWAMCFLPDGRAVVSQKAGLLSLLDSDGNWHDVAEVPFVDYGGQGGFGDVVPHPEFDKNGYLYFSWVEPGLPGHRGAVVERAQLQKTDGGYRLAEIERIWTQKPKTTGRGHYSHRIAFGPDGMLYITSGDRQKLTPAQDMDSALGKVIRLHDDGTVPADNPWQNQGELARTFWSTGHRNLLGIAFDAEGRLWQHEMGPRHGDELNIVKPGLNYGWPVVSEGKHYSGQPIPEHATRPEFEAPRAFWVPTIAPSGLVIYNGERFKGWQGDALMGGLASQALIRVELDGETAREAERFSWGVRIREVEQAPDGSIWVLEDGNDARLLRLEPQ